MRPHRLNACLFFLFLFTLTSLQAQTTFRGLMRKADQLFETNAFAPAVDAYRQALEKDPTDPDALGKLAECYRLLNRMDEAEATYLKLIRGRKYQDRQLLLYAHCLKGLGRYDEAKVYYQSYAKVNPTVGNQYVQSCDFAKANLNLPTAYMVINERVNSASSDFGPTFMNDQLVFSSLRTEGQTFSAQKSSLYTSGMSTDGSLQPAVVLRPGISDFSMGPASYSADGRNAATTKNNFTAGVRQIPGSGMDLSIVLAEVNFNGSWFNERPFPNNDNRGKTGFPSLTPDGNALFFASDRDGGFGGWDLYISYKEGSNWTKPINLGPAVNTPGDEITPYFDGQNLFFASDYHLGFGGFDVFMAEQGEGRWMKSTNLGQPVNSAADDYGFILDSYRNFGYMVSNRAGGLGMEDIYRVSKGGAPNTGVNPGPGQGNNNPGNNPNTGRTRIRIFSGSDGMAIANASVDLTSCMRGTSNYILMTDAQGYLELPFGAGTECEILVRAEGYLQLRGQLSSYLASNRDFEIPLTKTGEEYFGRVINSVSREFIPNVQIAARNGYSGTITRATTDYSGNYVLSLARNTPYTITYTAPNFREEMRNINVLNGADRTVLGTLSMVPQSGGGTWNGGTTNPPVNPNPNPNPNSGGNFIERPGFAIQVSAVSSQPDLAKFGNLRSIANVYAKNEGGRFKIKVGNFATREEAQGQLENVRRMGYPSAFVVTDDGVTLGGGGNLSPNLPNPNPGPTNPPVVNPPVNTAGRFMIQLGAYRDPRSFNGSKLVGMGSIQDRPKNEFTVKLLCCFTSAAEAFNALPRVQQAGFSGAFVVEELNGQLVRAK